MGDIPSHFELPWRRAFGKPYKDGVISYMGAGGQQTPLHYDDVENMVRPAHSLLAAYHCFHALPVAQPFTVWCTVCYLNMCSQPTGQPVAAFIYCLSRAVQDLVHSVSL